MMPSLSETFQRRLSTESQQLESLGGSYESHVQSVWTVDRHTCHGSRSVQQHQTRAPEPLGAAPRACIMSFRRAVLQLRNEGPRRSMRSSRMVTAPAVGTGPRYGAVPVQAREAHLSKPRACGEPSHSVCSFWLKSKRCDYLGVKRVARRTREQCPKN